MCERHPVPCWTFVDSPGSQCAGESHNNHNRVKQYDGDRTDITDWRRLESLRVIMNITFMCLTANGLLSIVHMSIYGTHIVIVWSCALVRTQLSNTAAPCDRRLSHTCHRNIHHILDPGQWRRPQECREQQTPVSCVRLQHMPAIGEGLQS